MNNLRIIFFLLLSCICIHSKSQQHLSLKLELEENDKFVPYLLVKLKNVSDKPITVSNNSLTEIRNRGRMLEGSNTVCCFKNTGKNGLLFYGGSFILDRENENLPLNPGEEVCFKTKLVGVGMPFDGAISFYNKQAQNYSQISCYLENILYTVDENGKKYDKLNLESNSIGILNLKIVDDELIKVTLNYNGEIRRYLLFCNSKTVPDKGEDFQDLYTRIMKKRGLSPITIVSNNEVSSISFNSGKVNIPSTFFNHRITEDDLADIYKYCLMGNKYRTSKSLYTVLSDGSIQLRNNSIYPKAYITDLVASIRETLAGDGIYYSLSSEKRFAFTTEMTYWQNLLGEGQYY